MNWTTNIPTKPGWYWKLRKHDGREYIEVVKIVKVGTSMMLMTIHNPTVSLNSIESNDGLMWYGPVSAPAR